MPVRLPLVTEDASRVLLEALIDYAGLFPPAGLTMPVAVRQYAHYRAGGTGWMLGRFICPAAALEQFSTHADPLLPRDAGAIPWRVSVTGSGDLGADLAAIAAFNERHRVCFDECSAVVDSLEVRADSEQAIRTIDAAVPRELTVYLELPLAQASALMPVVADTGRRAKMRTGGVVPEAFPAAEAVVAFLSACIAAGVTSKATAGLHHPVCGLYRLTYDEQATVGPMFGHLNLLVAAAWLLQGGDTARALALLTERDATRFQITPEQVVWEGPDATRAFDRTLLHRLRTTLLAGVGSCSFTEPVDELRALQWI